MLVFSQTTGIMSLNGRPVAQGWSGNHVGKGNPDMQMVHCVGPLPQGLYTLDGWEDQHPHLGPMVTHLTPDPDNVMFGRDAFYIHGPALDPAEYGQESMGCIVIPHAQRQAIKDSGETQLQVVA